MRDKKEIILTGFGTFGDLASNPSEKLINSLKSELQNELYRLFVLPVSYSYCSDWSKAYISESTSLVIHFGVSAKSKVIHLETRGRNAIGPTKDVEGAIPGNEVIENGPDTIQTKLDLDKVCKTLQDAGFECELSDNAGDYLCNYILYKSLTIAPDRSFFVHVPSEDEISIEELKRFTLTLIRNLQDQVK